MSPDEIALSPETVDEIVIFQSIYPDFLLSQRDQLLELQIPIELPDEAEFEVSSKSGGETTPSHTIKVNYLPPVLLSVILSEDYPSSNPPTIRSFSSRHAWLTEKAIQQLTAQLLKLWSYDEGVLCAWAEWINKGSFLATSPDTRLHIYHKEPVLLVPLLLGHDRGVRDAIFSSQTFQCPICLFPVKGAVSVSLSCSHVVCKECLYEFWSLCITEGSVERVRCPDPQCLKSGAEATPEEIKGIVTPEQYQRWTWLSHKRSNEQDPTTIYCPISACQSAITGQISVDGDDSGWSRLRTCPTCSFAFCNVCRRTWHGPHTTCVASFTANVVLEYMALEESEPKRKELERRFGKTFLQKLVSRFEEDRKNDRWFEESTTSCPGCQVKVEKSFGCNHMTCAKCQMHFCYLCGAKLNVKNPYSHFSAIQTPCYNQLFDPQPWDAQNNERIWMPMGDFEEL